MAITGVCSYTIHTECTTSRCEIKVELWKLNLAVLCCAVLYSTVLYCDVLCCTVMCCAVLYCTYCTVLCCTVCTVLCCTVLYCTVMCFTVLYLLYCTVLYCAVLYCTVLYCTVLYSPTTCSLRTHHRHRSEFDCCRPTDEGRNVNIQGNPMREVTVHRMLLQLTTARVFTAARQKGTGEGTQHTAHQARSVQSQHHVQCGSCIALEYRYLWSHLTGLGNNYKPTTDSLHLQMKQRKRRPRDVYKPNLQCTQH
jgi:hypothetical protein